MYKVIIVISSLFIASIASSVQAYEFQAISQQHILPGYKQLLSQNNQMMMAVGDYCDNEDNIYLENAKEAYLSAFGRWQSIQHIRFGPIEYLNRQHRYQMWPDKRGSVSKHLARLLKDPAINSPGFDISSKSVAVQGYSALERILFSEKSIGKTQCNLAMAISTNLAEMSNNLVNDWTLGDSAYVSYFNSATEGNDFFESDKELASKLLNSLYTQLEFMITQKIDRPMGASIEKARGKRVEGWRSQTSLPALRSNLNAIYQLYLLAYGITLDYELSEKIEMAFMKSKQALNTISMPLDAAIKDPEQRNQVALLRQELSLLKKLITTDMATALDLSLGFNSLDGD